MTQHIRAREHEAISLCIKSAKRRMFERSRNGCDLGEAVEGFLADVRQQCERIVEIGGAAAMAEKDAERFDELEKAIRLSAENDCQKGGAQ